MAKDLEKGRNSQTIELPQSHHQSVEPHPFLGRGPCEGYWHLPRCLPRAGVAPAPAQAAPGTTSSLHTEPHVPKTPLFSALNLGAPQDPSVVLVSSHQTKFLFWSLLLALGPHQAALCSLPPSRPRTQTCVLPQDTLTSMHLANPGALQPDPQGHSPGASSSLRGPSLEPVWPTLCPSLPTGLQKHFSNTAPYHLQPVVT